MFFGPRSAQTLQNSRSVRFAPGPPAPPPGPSTFVKSRLDAPLGRPRAVSNYFFSVLEASKSAPRRFQEGFGRLPRRRCDSDVILDPLMAPKSEPGTSKSKKNIEKTIVFKEITVFSSDRFWTWIWHPPGLLLGGYLAPRQFKIGLLGALGPSKSRSKVTFFGSKSLQERSKRRPRALHTPLEGILWPTKPFSRAQEASRTPTRGLQGPFGSHVSRILKQFCYPFEAMLPPCWSRFLAEGSFAGTSKIKETPWKNTS